MYLPRKYHHIVHLFLLLFSFNKCDICIISSSSSLPFFREGLGPYITPLELSLKTEMNRAQVIASPGTSDISLLTSYQSLLDLQRKSCWGQLYKHACETHKPRRPCSIHRWPLKGWNHSWRRTQGSPSSTFPAVGTSRSCADFPLN
jgi:hypothetical protein